MKRETYIFTKLHGYNPEDLSYSLTQAMKGFTFILLLYIICNFNFLQHGSVSLDIKVKLTKSECGYEGVPSSEFTHKHLSWKHCKTS